MSKYIKLVLWIVGYLGVSSIIGQLTHAEIPTWYNDLAKPSFNPPNWIFPVMWSFLYVLIATAGWKLWLDNSSKELKIIYIVYTLSNWAWTPIFFIQHQLALGFFWIVAVNAINFLFLLRAWSQNRIATYFMTPVFLWTLFAMVLNYNIWQLNV